MNKAKVAVKTPTPPSKTMKVGFLRSPKGKPFFLAYNTGDIIVLDKKLALDLIEAGVGEQIKEVKAARKTAVKAKK